MGILQEGAKLLLKDELTEIRNQSISDQSNIEFLVERYAELELALEDANWLKLTYGTERELSREALGKIAYLARMYYLKNPIIHRGISTKQDYVWGTGVTVRSKNEEVNAVIQEFWNDDKNRKEFTSHNAQILKELDLECDGNIFLVLFTNTSNGDVRLRSIPFDQMQDIITNPQDAKDPWLYLRKWMDSKGKAQKELYPDWQYVPKRKNKTRNNVTINDKALIMHIKAGGFSDWKFGCSEIYSALDWAKAYKEFLEDWATITRALARFAWKSSGAKNKAAMDNIKTKLASTWSSTSTETNPKPGVGSIAITKEGYDFQPMKTAGATTTPESGRRILLMAASAFGLPETFFGDASVGSLATAQSLNRPTELQMKSRQTFWKDIIADLLNYVLLWSVKAGDLKGKGLATVEKNLDGSEDLNWVEGDFNDVVEITFPSVIAPDKFKEVEALSKVAPLGLIDEEQLTKMFLIALGEQDVEQIMENMKEDDEITESIKAFIEKHFKVKEQK